MVFFISPARLLPVKYEKYPYDGCFWILKSVFFFCYLKKYENVV